jgi:hypothetical protein
MAIRIVQGGKCTETNMGQHLAPGIEGLSDAA